MAKPSLPQGTRDFGPDVVRKRNHIFNTIRNVFELYGFQPLETPAMKRPPNPSKGGALEPSLNLNRFNFINGKD